MRVKSRGEVSVLQISTTDFEFESRLIKEVQTIRATHPDARVIVFSRGRNQSLPRSEAMSDDPLVQVIRDEPVVRFFPGTRVGTGVAYLKWMLSFLRLARRHRPRFVTARAVETLFIGWLASLCSGAKLVYSPHELEPEKNGYGRFEKFRALVTEFLFIRHAKSVVVVGFRIADLYRKRYRLSNVFVVPNAPKRLKAEGEAPFNLRRKLGLDESVRLYGYQGALVRGRGIDLLCQAFSGGALEGAALVFIGFGGLEHEIRRYVGENPGRIFLLGAVPPNQLLPLTAQLDCGICLIEPICLSYELSLPNKLFEYIAAGVPVIASDLPEMAEVVETHGVGLTTRPSVEGIRSAVRVLGSQEIANYRENSRNAASKLNWENFEGELISVYEY